MDTQVPVAIIAGDSAKWTKDAPDNKPADGWVLTYYFTNRLANTFSLVCTNNGDGTHLATLTAAASLAGFTATGSWNWFASVTKGSEKITIDRGTIDVIATIVVGQKVDNRSWAQQMLDAVEATMKGQATSNQLAMSYTTAGGGSRSIQHSSLAELAALRLDLIRQVNAEDLAESFGVGRNIGVRFSR